MASAESRLEGPVAWAVAVTLEVVRSGQSPVISEGRAHGICWWTGCGT